MSDYYYFPALKVMIDTDVLSFLHHVKSPTLSSQVGYTHILHPEFYRLKVPSQAFCFLLLHNHNSISSWILGWLEEAFPFRYGKQCNNPTSDLCIFHFYFSWCALPNCVPKPLRQCSMLQRSSRMPVSPHSCQTLAITVI